ncbi:MAG: family 16 glycosylhydrolase, partial [Dehalococcoidia bacterium]
MPAESRPSPSSAPGILSCPGLSQPGDKAFANVAGLELDAFHVYRVRWLPDRVQWFVDGALVREESGTVPD